MHQHFGIKKKKLIKLLLGKTFDKSPEKDWENGKKYIFSLGNNSSKISNSISPQVPNPMKATANKKRRGKIQF